MPHRICRRSQLHQDTVACLGALNVGRPVRKSSNSADVVRGGLNQPGSRLELHCPILRVRRRLAFSETTTMSNTEDLTWSAAVMAVVVLIISPSPFKMASASA